MIGLRHGRKFHCGMTALLSCWSPSPLEGLGELGDGTPLSSRRSDLGKPAVPTRRRPWSSGAKQPPPSRPSATPDLPGISLLADYSVDPGQHVVAEALDHLNCAQVLPNLLDSARSSDHGGNMWVGRTPGQRELG